ncbi:phosphotransferase family protein [Nocardia mexicana]|uniref:Aminoglycoside phosphotransferase (APT) family kinase protein n=1 Tax=Nocardia mexicana TaxID=279262 RepID=A0A370GLH8_9NOCA|nr:phosphotransferase family protein [Nocardia mexicana]RDI44622.1 aminoglycoside phosphotransferase (APT) family kinase protein [Nocardia mexicana]
MSDDTVSARFDLPRLAAWMDEVGLPGGGAPLAAVQISGGAQNEIYEIRRGEHRSVLRIPPAAAPSERDKGILREWRITAALRGTDVPHAPGIAVCADPQVLGRAFYLMGYVDGWSPMQHQKAWPEPFATDAQARAELAYQLAEGIALLSRVDWRAQGLGDLGRPEGFHERQVQRWTSMFERSRGRDIEGMDTATAWLSAHRPLDFVPGIMHGDYQWANVMYRHGGPARLAAIVDWEMGTIGDPKLDLAWALTDWPQSYVDMRDMPPREQMVARFAEISGRQVDDLDYYLILARWKLAIVLEQGYQRAGDNPKLQAFGPLVPRLMRGAAELAESTDYRS